MRPIPRAMLIHTVTLADASGSAYGSETLTPIAELKRVRVEPDESALLTHEDTQAKHTALLLYDARNSLPGNVTFTPEQRVLFGGKTYRVVAVEPLYDGARLHHIEVSLSE